jgi:glycosyltransferase involved in cell wall biosynthesis
MTNFGQSAAFQAGFDAVRGDYVIIVAGDLETPLENLNKVIEYLDYLVTYCGGKKTIDWNEWKDWNDYNL